MLPAGFHPDSDVCPSPLLATTIAHSGDAAACSSACSCAALFLPQPRAALRGAGLRHCGRRVRTFARCRSRCAALMSASFLLRGRRREPRRAASAASRVRRHISSACAHREGRRSRGGKGRTECPRPPLRRPRLRPRPPRLPPSACAGCHAPSSTQLTSSCGAVSRPTFPHAAAATERVSRVSSLLRCRRGPRRVAGCRTLFAAQLFGQQLRHRACPVVAERNRREGACERTLPSYGLGQPVGGDSRGGLQLHGLDKPAAGTATVRASASCDAAPHAWAARVPSTRPRAARRHAQG